MSTAASIYFYHHTPSGQSRVYRVTQLRADGVHCRESAGTGPVVLKVVRVTGAAFASSWTNYYCASLFSHTHYWYKVSMFKYKYQYYYCCTALWTRFPSREDCCIVQVTCKIVAFRFFLTHSEVRIPWFSLRIRVSCTPTKP